MDQESHEKYAKELEKALCEFNTFCFELLQTTDFDIDGFHNGVRHVIKKYTELVQPIIEKNNRILH